MRKILLATCLLLGAALPAMAQGGFTTVTGTITDPNGLKYACGTISAQLITAGGAAPTLNGGGFTTQTSPVGLGCQTTPGTGAAGSFTMRLADSGVIVPSNTTWRFTVNMTPGIPPPAGNGPQSFSFTTAINCSTNTPSTCTSNAMDISTQLSGLAPALSQAISALQQGTSNPACVAGQAFLFLNTSSNQLLICNNGILTTASGSPATLIDLKQFGVVADLRTCVGTQGTLTGGSPTFTCTGANFCNAASVACPAGQTSDVGKRINGTQGCCNLSPGGSPATTQVIPNNTTILTVNSPTSVTMSANTTVTPVSANTLFVWWATDDDAAVALADTAYQNAPTATGMLWPGTPFLVKNPHFNAPNPQGLYINGGGIGGLREPAGTYVGWGPNASVMYLDATFPNSTPCGFGLNSNGCFFSYQGVHAEHLGISGGWNLVPNGGGHSYVLVNSDISAYFLDDVFAGFAGGDGTSVGLRGAGFSNYESVFVQQFGKNCATANTGNNVFDQGYYGNCYGPSFQIAVGTGSPTVTRGVTFGTVPNTANEVTFQSAGGGQWWSYGDYFYGGGSTCIANLGGSPLTAAYIDGATVGGNGTCPIAFATGASSSSFFVRNSTITSSTTALNLSSGALFQDQCGNTWTGAGVLTIAATAIFVPCANPLASTFATTPAAGKLNCASSAAPAVCGAYATGSVVVAATATTVVVNTTAVTANSQIILTFDSSLGTKLGVTCNTTVPAVYSVSARTAGTSFTITATASVTNPACFNYQIVN